MIQVTHTCDLCGREETRDEASTTEPEGWTTMLMQAGKRTYYGGSRPSARFEKEKLVCDQCLMQKFGVTFDKYPQGAKRETVPEQMFNLLTELIAEEVQQQVGQ